LFYYHIVTLATIMSRGGCLEYSEYRAAFLVLEGENKLNRLV